jgi:hypothetical protein
MNITIEGPSFYDQEDENVFFGCIYALPSFVEVRGHGIELTITFETEPTEETILKLLVICRRWGIEIGPLRTYEEKYKSECYLWDNAISSGTT